MLEVYPISIFLISAFICLLFSFLFHLFCDMSETVSNRFKYLDYAGISILISGSSFSLYYYYFYCRPVSLFIYSTMIFGFSTFVFVISLGSYIHRPENVQKKAYLYGGLGLSNFLPFFHMFYLCLFSK